MSHFLAFTIGFIVGASVVLAMFFYWAVTDAFIPEDDEVHP